MNSSTPGKTGLPESDFRELKEGEVYVPVMDPQAPAREVTHWSVLWGLAMAVIFSAAAAYSGLKIGQVFEAAIPIAILAVGISTLFRTKGALGQNVIIQSIGSTSGAVVAGAIFTMYYLFPFRFRRDDPNLGPSRFTADRRHIPGRRRTSR